MICSILIAPGDAFICAQTGQGPQTIATVEQQQSRPATPQQLESLVAPIALYPDPLLAQVLAASTYPLEIVTAGRWVKEHSQLQGKALVEAAGKQDWDPSVQALVAFPSVLQMLDQNLDWTTTLGNMFLAQQADVMAAVQRMRMKAQQSGKLESNAQQQVQTTSVEGQPTVVIQPANPEVIYVPSYDPAAVYGAAPAYYPYPAIAYPAYPYGAAAISFGLGVAVGAIFNGCCGGGWGWGWGANWGPRPSLYVNNNFFNHNRNAFVNRGNWGNAYRGNGNAGWNHNPRFRGGVPYPNRDVANRFNGGRTGSLRPTQLPSNIGNIRPPGGGNLAGRGGVNRPGGGNLAGRGGVNRPGVVGPGQLPAHAGANRPGGGRAGGGAVAGQVPRVPHGNRPGAFRGGSSGHTPAFNNRGARGMGGSGFRGGGFHGGGGFRGGGHRGGGGFRGGGRRR